MASSQVRPTESSEEREEREPGDKNSIDLFEVLEDRYAYEGFNKFLFYCFVKIISI